MRKDVIVTQAMGAGLVAWLVFSGSMLPVREALTVAALLLGVSIVVFGVYQNPYGAEAHGQSV